MGSCVQWKWLWVDVGFMGASENKDRPLASGCALKDFTDDALTISPGNLFQGETT